MDLEMRGSVALVTGASRGIGLAVARTLAAEGCAVGLVARGAEALQGVEEELKATGAVALALSADVTDRVSVDSAVERFSRELGRIEILVNNAGGSSGFGRQFDELSDEDWEEAFRLNLLSAVRVTRAVLPGMREAGQGSIVMVATDAAAQPGGFVPHYTTAKAGILNLARSLSRKYGPEGIRVNTVSPGMVRTTQLTAFLEQRAKSQGTTVEEAERALVRESRPDITAGRAGTPEEIAAVVAFLASPRASYVNGANWRVDSGEVLSIV